MAAARSTDRNWTNRSSETEVERNPLAEPDCHGAIGADKIARRRFASTGGMSGAKSEALCTEATQPAKVEIAHHLFLLLIKRWNRRDGRIFLSAEKR